jgi:hypothetical protein
MLWACRGWEIRSDFVSASKPICANFKAYSHFGRKTGGEFRLLKGPV